MCQPLLQLAAHELSVEIWEHHRGHWEEIEFFSKSSLRSLPDVSCCCPGMQM